MATNDISLLVRVVIHAVWYPHYFCLRIFIDACLHSDFKRLSNRCLKEIVSEIKCDTSLKVGEAVV